MLGVPEDGVDDHCWKCITVNRCWFKNEDNKKPEEFDYSKYSLIETPMEIRGLYHPNCHCKKFALKTPKVEDIKFLMLQGKIDYFFKDKLNWYYSWGYKDEDREEFINLVKGLVAQSFVNGDYECEQHSQYGYKINIFITIPGKNEKVGHIYKTWSCYMIFPNGKLKLNTVIGGKEE